ncbi:MAG: nucleoside-diphosphate sugar epimerase/dehydratase [Hydrogenophaga sp.]|uniref:polysaccharide biosynthesis protein n=1 Tax=Hydrogenophaga sp. TaxID=1904254 RepID=UPI002ABC0781|nr:nucleoside-diphosphate sugar epimerase/dehydratase [Hydrogenophaga sp.]MDZ4101079.1 nucleoside-diphosphate sugar epimerase/dehydratase [Hydrogenophaga sp.]
MNNRDSETSAATVLLDMPRLAKRVVAVAVDVSLCVLTVWLALCLRLEHWVRLEPVHGWAMLGSVLLALPLFVRFGLYRAIFRYAGWNAMVSLVQAMALYGLFYATVFTVISVPGIPRTVGVIQPMLLMAFVGFSRVVVRYWLGGLYRSALRQKDLPGVLIYGAGAAGRQLAAALARGTEHRLLGFLDDDEQLHGNSLDGRTVHSPAALPDLIPELGVTDLLLALPSITHQRRMQVLESLRHLPVHVRTMPGMSDLAAGRVSLNDVRELEIEDLLGREPVTPDASLLLRLVHDKVVLITGAGGSIGSELCRQIAACRPHTLLLVENSEFALYQIHHELTALVGSQTDPLDGEEGDVDAPMVVTLVPLLASVQDEERMTQIMQTWRPHAVYHAAAYKHVPLVEHNPAQGLRNNVWGTLVCARSAQAAGVGHFVLISTDKAVRPTNIMGASKRMAELVLQALAAEPGPTTFSMVRFGNVLGSSGSVVPLFRQQIKDGGPITLTHPDITRYFMTIPEAAQLVIQAGAMAQGGDVFVLDMGQPVRIMDLAQRMVELSGLQVKTALNPTGDIEIQTTGLRPGEKLYEELLIGDDPQPTQHPRILRAREEFQPWSAFQLTLEALSTALTEQDIPAARALLQRCVQGYQPTGDVVDWVHVAERGVNEPASSQLSR